MTLRYQYHTTINWQCDKNDFETYEVEVQCEIELEFDCDIFDEDFTTDMLLKEDVARNSKFTLIYCYDPVENELEAEKIIEQVKTAFKENDFLDFETLYDADYTLDEFLTHNLKKIILDCTTKLKEQK